MKYFAKYIVATIIVIPIAVSAQTIIYPEKDYKDLFVDVQMKRVFPDNKTFADAVALSSVDSINYWYYNDKSTQGFQLADFTRKHFTTRPAAQAPANIEQSKNVVAHIEALWSLLERNPKAEVKPSSLIPLPHEYIVPGGRFQEVYYWDSYFTMLGLAESGKFDLIGHILDNFAYLIDTYGHIPNGNRSYFLSRSQPPYFALMVNLLAQHNGNDIIVKYLPQLQKEYDYWMDKRGGTSHKVVLSDGTVLNRYWDQKITPREESFYEDSTLAIGRSDKEILYRNLRSGAESGWDFSTRWFSDKKTLATINTTDILPVDLNCLLYNLEQTLGQGYSLAGDTKRSMSFTGLAQNRKRAIEKYFFNKNDGWYYDYVLSKRKLSTEKTIAGMTPFFFKLPHLDKIYRAAHIVKNDFLKPGGVVTTMHDSGQQWDAPNGWAPLQWIAIEGLNNYKETDLATDIAKRWIALNTKVFENTGKLMEKYNVENIKLTAGGGEYPSQDGFGWTNGVLLKLIKMYGAQ
ncbi:MULTISPECIES: alpha,alpha-trehalase TreA [Chitinophagaceae]